MTLDHNSLERLRELRRNLPQPLPSSSNSKKNKKPDSKLHPIETEENPQQLFKELINASSNGEIPTHLISRLKEVESLDSKKKASPNSNNNIKYSDEGSPSQLTNSSSKIANQTNDLYISFKQLLLEED